MPGGKCSPAYPRMLLLLVCPLLARDMLLLYWNIRIIAHLSPTAVCCCCRHLSFYPTHHVDKPELPYEGSTVFAYVLLFYYTPHKPVRLYMPRYVRHKRECLSIYPSIGMTLGGDVAMCRVAGSARQHTPCVIVLMAREVLQDTTGSYEHGGWGRALPHSLRPQRVDRTQLFFIFRGSIIMPQPHTLP